MFVNDDGEIKLIKPFPKRMTWKQAKQWSVEKHEFVLSEVEAGNEVCDDGRLNTCALCHRAGITGKSHWVLANCNACIIYKKTGERGCDGTPYEDISLSEPETIQAEIDFLKLL